MFCPKCGSNQGDGKKFCTGCGTNLLIVSQALTGQLPTPPVHFLPPAPAVQNSEWQSEMRTGVLLAVLGGGYLFYKIISFIFLAPFYGWRSPFGFLGFVAFILFAIGISKVISSRAAATAANPVNPPLVFESATEASFPPMHRASVTAPQPVFSTTAESVTPRTNELEPVKRPAASVTEEETRQLSR